MEIRIAGTVDDSIVDGPGLRFTVFTQGCPHNCEGCHNPDTHAMDGGKATTTEKLIEEFRENPLLDGITLSGGDPFCQAKACTLLAKAAKEADLNVWAYTGYTWEALLRGANEENGWRELLETIDVLVDGPFLLKERTLELKWRGSPNQRLIRVPESLSSGAIQLYEA